jgi:hypothetical protein
MVHTNFTISKLDRLSKSGILFPITNVAWRPDHLTLGHFLMIWIPDESCFQIFTLLVPLPPQKEVNKIFRILAKISDFWKLLRFLKSCSYKNFSEKIEEIWAQSYQPRKA